MMSSKLYGDISSKLDCYQKSSDVGDELVRSVGVELSLGVVRSGLVVEEELVFLDKKDYDI